ncbi:hypothetical protein [Amycolatopsis sp. NPDC059657]
MIKRRTAGVLATVVAGTAWVVFITVSITHEPPPSAVPCATNSATR